jgi:hypothetical protein
MSDAPSRDAQTKEAHGTHMDPYFAGLALASALLHAGWNTFVKVAGDRLVAIATISGMFKDGIAA